MSSEDATRAAIETVIRNHIHLGLPVPDVIVIDEPSDQRHSFIFDIDGSFYGAQGIPREVWTKEHDVTKSTGYRVGYFGKDDMVYAKPVQRVRNGVVLE